MKYVLKIAVVLAFIAGSFSCASQSSKKAKLKTSGDTASYMIGMSIGANMGSMPGVEDINPELIYKGLADVLNEGDTLFNMMEMQMFLQKWSMAAKEKADEQAKTDNSKFLDDNKKEEGIVVTESGLQYRVIKEGTGDKPTAESKVKVNYTGKLIDGSVFDSSVERGEPAQFGLNQVIPGWTEGIQLMSVGSTYEFYIPYDLAYGPRGHGQIIPPYATLIFEVELLDILPAEEKAE